MHKNKLIFSVLFLQAVFSQNACSGQEERMEECTKPSTEARHSLPGMVSLGLRKVPRLCPSPFWIQHHDLQQSALMLRVSLGEICIPS